MAYKKLLALKENQSTVEKASEDALFIKSDRKYYKIAFTDIRFIEALKDYVVIYTRNNKLITAMNLKTIHQKLPVSLFARTSKSYLINLSFIDLLITILFTSISLKSRLVRFIENLSLNNIQEGYFDRIVILGNHKAIQKIDLDTITT
jgi:hypothetical protein